MIKVLIAEDEFPLLRGIAKLIEKADQDFSVVMLVKNGKEALEYLENHEVDVVFTDINMPLVDGLQILKYIKEKKPWIISVVISGYQDFSYAQQAIRYEAKRYLIKPIENHELCVLLQELKDQILSQKETKKDMLLKKLLFGKKQIGNSEYESRNSEEKIEFRNVYPVYMVAKAYCTSNIEESEFDSEFWNNVDFRIFLKNEIQSLIGTYTYYGKYLNEIIVLLETEATENIELTVAKYLQRKEHIFPIAIIAGDVCTDIFEIGNIVSQLRKKLRRNWKYGRCEVINEDNKCSLFRMKKSTEESLQYMIKQGKFKGFQELLTEIQKQMEEENITQYDLEETLKKILMFIQTYETGFLNEEISNPTREINDIIMRSNSLSEIFEEFVFWCQRLMFPKAEENTAALVRRVDAFIQDHYTERITTKMLAQEFGLVPSYLSRLFREYKGVTPNHYIQNIRIERSKEMLLNCPTVMTKDIALMVGYVDASYFFKVFKKNTGLSPSEYRMNELSK